MRGNFPVLVVCILMLTSCNLSELSSVDEECVHIVSVGIDYTNSKVSDLHGTVADASEVALCLSDIYTSHNIYSNANLMIQDALHNDEEDFLYPSGQNILRELSSINAGKNDLIVFYFSGHGEKDQNGVFLAGAKNESGEFSKVYISDLYSILESKNCACLMILDCCYAGNAVDYSMPDRLLSDAFKTMFSKHRPSNRVAIIASCNKDCNSLVSSVATEEGCFENHSLFTSHFLQSLGWCHTTSTVRNFSGLEVAGKLEKQIGVTTVHSLVSELSLSDKYSSQIPVANRTDVPVLVVPYKE